MSAKSIALRPAIDNMEESVEMDEEQNSDMDEIEDDANQSAAPKYLPCEEVQEQMKQLWANEDPLLSQIWGKENGWQQFFLQVRRELKSIKTAHSGPCLCLCVCAGSACDPSSLSPSRKNGRIDV